MIDLSLSNLAVNATIVYDARAIRVPWKESILRELA